MSKESKSEEIKMEESKNKKSESSPVMPKSSNHLSVN